MDEEVLVLLIDDEAEPYYTYDNDFEEFQALELEFLESYLENKDGMDLTEWLHRELAKHLPEVTDTEISDICSEIIETVQMGEEKQRMLKSALQEGRSKESWLASEAKKAVSYMSGVQSAEYLHGLDIAMKTANEEMAKTIFTRNRTINLNPNLDGFIAERYHANTFNLNAASTGSSYRAEVLQPKPGQTFTKNSVDIVIKDGQGKVVRRYQSKYCSDIKSTGASFEKGDYRGQRRLAPGGQSEGIKKACEQLEAPDGTTSTPLTKQQAKSLQQEAQSGKPVFHDWNEYQLKNLAAGIGKEAGIAALQSAAIGTGIDIAGKLYRGEKIKGEEVLQNALKIGADAGVKAALSGALKVAVEKGAIGMIPKGTPAGTLANIVTVGVENVKVMRKVAEGQLTLAEGLNEMEAISVSTVAGIMASTEGMALGATLGSVFGPIGTMVGGFVGGIVGYAAGSRAGGEMVKSRQKMRAAAVKTLEQTWGHVTTHASKAWQHVKSFGQGIFT